MRISDWSSDVCSSDLAKSPPPPPQPTDTPSAATIAAIAAMRPNAECGSPSPWVRIAPVARSEEHTSELQSLMRISYAVFCLKKKKKNKNKYDKYIQNNRE